MIWSCFLSIFITVIVKCLANKSENTLYQIWNQENWGSPPENPADIASILFHKFADKRKGISTEVFEQLVQCTLGASDCQHMLTMSQDEKFLFLTDCKLNTALSPALCDILHNCSSGIELLSAVVPSSNTTDVITEDKFRLVLPALLYQSQTKKCRAEDFDSLEVTAEVRPTSAEVWGYGILFVTLISACSLAGVSVLPLMARAFYQRLLTALIGLAVGSLAASAVFHLIPQAFHITGTNGGHDYLFISLFILIGIWAFFLIERFLKIVFAAQHKPEKGHEMHEIHFRQGEDSVIATVAWMIIFGDGFHNFIDGVSIGAAFQQSILTGISISLAVMCEELPHELGDFAVLINSGMTMKQALFYNFLSALTCYIGMVIGIVLGEFTQDSTYIFALAAGMFLYISLVDMLPEMNETASKAAEKSVKDVIQVLLLQNLGMFVGVFSLFFLAYYQDYITLG